MEVSVVGNEQLGAEGRGIGLPHVPREDVAKVSRSSESAPWVGRR